MDAVGSLAIAGLVLGSMYALASLGLVLIYRTSGVINFAQGAMGMFGTFVAWQLIVGWGWPKPAGVALAVAFGAALGYAVERLTIRPVAGVLPRVVVTLGWLLALQAAAGLVWGSSGFHEQIILFPIRGIEIGGVAVGVDQIALVGITLALVGASVLVFKRTSFGLALRAVSDDAASARLIGIRAGRVSGAAWAIGGALATLAGILLSPSQPLDTVQLTLLITQAYAAAMVGGLVSLPLTFAGALLLGVVQSVVPRYWSAVGVRELLAVALILVVLWLRRNPGQRQAAAGDERETGPAERAVSVPRRRDRARRATRRGAAVAVVAVVILLSQTLPSSWATTLSFAATFALAGLSVVILTGFVGQISLAQAAFMGVGALMTGKAVVQWGIPFWAAMPLAALAAAAVGVVVGLPSLRARGLHLAVATLAAGVAFDRFVFNRSELVGEAGSWSFPRPRLLGADLSSDRAWFLVCLGFLLAFAAVAAGLRRSRTGTLLAAVRESEQAAASLGWPVARVKLLGFAVSAFVAGWAGALVAGTFEGASAAPFDFRQSIALVAITVIAGIRSVAAVGFVGAFRFVLPRVLGGSGGVDDLLTGVALVAQVLLLPGGVAAAMRAPEDAAWRRLPLGRRRAADAEVTRDAA